MPNSNGKTHRNLKWLQKILASQYQYSLFLSKPTDNIAYGVSAALAERTCGAIFLLLNC